MEQMDSSFRKECERNPVKIFQAVIVLANEADMSRLDEIGLANAKPIGFQSGMFVVTASGKELLNHMQHKEILQITKDQETTML